MTASPIIRLVMALALIGLGGIVTAAPASATGTTWTASTDFSATQGLNAWSYYQRDTATGLYTTQTWAGSYWQGGGGSYTAAGTMHPAVGYDTALRWVAPTTGTIRISGEVRKHTVGGDGVVARVLHNGVERWHPSSPGNPSSPVIDTAGYSANLVLPVTAGDTILFVVGSNGTWDYDATLWDPSIRYVSSVAATDPSVAYFGRWVAGSSGAQESYWGGANLRTSFTGTSLSVLLAGRADFSVSIDGGPWAFHTDADGKDGPAVVDLTPTPLAAGTHTVHVATRDYVQRLKVSGFLVDPGEGLAAPPARGAMIEFIGDSISAGVGTSASALTAYPWLTGELLDADHSQIAYGGICLTVDSTPVSQRCETEMSSQYFQAGSPSDPAAPWNFTSPPDAVVINLGTNDDLLLDANEAAFEAAYVDFLEEIRARYPAADIFVLRTFGNYLTAATQSAVDARNLAGDTDVHYIDTLGWVDASVDPTDFTMPDNVHPNDAGQRKIARLLAGVLSGYGY